MPQRSSLRQSFLLVTFFLMLNIIGYSSLAQSFCSNDTQLFAEDFGMGTIASSHPDIITTALTYQPSGVLFNEGVYRVINNSQQKSDWHNSPDHTGNTDGKMLVVNGNGNNFYSHVINNAAGFPAGDYTAGLYFMNVNKDNLCGTRILAPFISFILEYQDQTNGWVAFAGSPLAAPSVPLSATPTWVKLGGIFGLPATGNFIVQNIRLTINNGLPGGCGNDFAMDDIRIAMCPGAGPLPVNFINVSARQTGAGVTIDWSTAAEINNKYYDVESSVDGGINWNFVSTLKSSGGNNTGIKNYNAIDHKPAAGYNYYRIRQVDQDGSFTYSPIAKVKVNIDKTLASVITNPVISNIGIDFLSKTSQSITISLFDMTGKKIASDKWIIPNGASRRTFDKANNIGKGVYVLTIQDENGLTIYNGKLVK